MMLTLSISPAGNTTSREVLNATQQVRSALERTPGIQRTVPQRVKAPEQAKGVADALGTLMVTLVPDVLKTTFSVLKESLARHPPTKILIEHGATKLNFEFDPKTTSMQDLAAFAERLQLATKEPGKWPGTHS